MTMELTGVWSQLSQSHLTLPRIEELILPRGSARKRGSQGRDPEGRIEGVSRHDTLRPRDRSGSHLKEQP